MNKFLPVILAASLVFFVFGCSEVLAQSALFAQSPIRYYDWSATLDTQKQVLGVVFAQESTLSYEKFDRYILGGNLTPDKPFYFIKPLQENWQLFTTFDNRQKEELRLKIAGERLEEMQQLSAGGDSAALKTAALNYQRALDTSTAQITYLKNSQVDVSKLLQKVEEETAKHTVVLEEVSTKVPDAASEALDNAIDASYKGADTVADLNGKPALPTDVVDRLQSLKAQGILTEEEVSKLVAAKTRSEARVEIKKYVNEGLVPEADFISMSENLKTYYPDDFYKLHEVKRFYELKKLEEQRPDQTTLTKIQEFAKTYKSGEVVPADIRKYWAPVIRLDEIQNTLRPDLIDEKFVKGNDADYKKFTEVVERFKPRPEDITQIKNYIEKNNLSVSQLPAEYQRLYNLGQRYGTQDAKPPTTSTSQKTSCPTNAHFVPVPYSPDGGYCVPNYTPTSGGGTTTIEAKCPTGYHRNYAGGACIQDYNSDGSKYNLPPLTSTPGNYPNPIYSGYSPLSRDEQEKICSSGGGSCDWGSGVCNCKGYRGAPVTTNTQPSSCSNYTSGMCGQSGYFDWSSCSCKSSNYTPPSSYTPPTGYGSCPSGQYWNGSTCVTTPTNTYTPSITAPSGSTTTQNTSPTGWSRESQEAGCRACNGSCNWNGDFCSCQCNNSGSTTTPTSGSSATPAPTPQPTPQGTPDPNAGCASVGMVWNGSNCVAP